MNDTIRNLKIETAKRQIDELSEVFDRLIDNDEATDAIVSQMDSLHEEIEALERGDKKIKGGTECRFHFRHDEFSRSSLGFERRLLKDKRDKARWLRSLVGAN